MPPDVLQNGDSLFRHLSWILPYYLDWGPCGQEVRMMRGYATVLRWFEDPGDRSFQIFHIRERVFAPNRFIGEQLQKNLTDLMDSDTIIGPWIPAGLFGLFLNRMAAGDLIDGGPTDPGWPPNLVAIRPGYFFALSQWQSFMPDLPFPWPFWVFPSTVDPASI